MSGHKNMDEEFALFQALSPSETNRPVDDAQVASAVGHIRADLVSSRYRLAAVFSAASLFGYLLTLAICAQNGVSIFGSTMRSDWLMALIPHQWCAVVCGALFNGIPTLTALLLLNRFQRRFLLFKMPWLLVIAPLLGCGALAIMASGDHSGHFSGAFYLVWLCSALVTPYAIEGLAALVWRQRSQRYPQ